MFSIKNGFRQNRKSYNDLKSNKIFYGWLFFKTKEMSINFPENCSLIHVALVLKSYFIFSGNALPPINKTLEKPSQSKPESKKVIRFSFPSIHTSGINNSDNAFIIFFDAKAICIRIENYKAIQIKN